MKGVFYIYILTEESTKIKGTGTIVTYGIAYIDNDSVIVNVRNISDNAETVKGLIDLFNNEKLNPDHLSETIDCYLCSLAF